MVCDASSQVELPSIKCLMVKKKYSTPDKKDYQPREVYSRWQAPQIEKDHCQPTSSTC